MPGSQQLSVSSQTSQQRVTYPITRTDTLTEAFTFAWRTDAENSEDDPGMAITREILSDPQALTEIAAAREEIARGDVVRGIDNVRALRPRR
jgi:hypothetical protein